MADKNNKYDLNNDKNVKDGLFEEVNENINLQNDYSEESDTIILKKKKSKVPLIVGLGIVALLVILLLSGLAYAVSSNMIPLPFMSVEMLEPTITATTDDTGSVVVNLNNPNSGGVIYYTLDGSDPLTNSSKYEAPITLTATAALKARVIDDKDNMSEVISQQFTIAEKPVEVAAPATVETLVIQPDLESVLNDVLGTWKATADNGWVETYTITKTGADTGHVVLSQIGPKGNGDVVAYDFTIAEWLGEGTSTILLKIIPDSLVEGGITLQDTTIPIDCKPYEDGAINIFNGVYYYQGN